MDVQHKEMLLASLKKFNSCDVVLGGTSMWPFIRSGDTVTIRYKPFRPLPGMVVAFFDEDQLIVHRVLWYKNIGNKEWKVLVYGDSCPYSFSSIRSDQIAGVVASVKRGNHKCRGWFLFPFALFAIPVGFMLQFLVAGKRMLRSIRGILHPESRKIVL